MNTDFVILRLDRRIQRNDIYLDPVVKPQDDGEENHIKYTKIFTQPTKFSY